MSNKVTLMFSVFKIPVLGCRLDLFLKILFSQYSRTFLKKIILNNEVFINGNICCNPDKKISYKDLIVISFTIYKEKYYLAEKISLNIVYEDNDILVIDKQDNFIVHPGAGIKSGTLLNALLYKDNVFFNVPRAGIVHRLDKNTTGLMVIAKTVLAYYNLINQIKLKKVVREYQAIVYGRVISGGTIIKPIIRNPYKRISMMVNQCGKIAITHYRVIQRYSYHTHLKIKLETGRTHQIRVHMLYINFPIVGDQLYGNKYKFYKNIKEEFFQEIRAFSRQALHASKLCLYHPVTQCFMEWNSKLPKDILNLIKLLNCNM